MVDAELKAKLDQRRRTVAGHHLKHKWPWRGRSRGASGATAKVWHHAAAVRLSPDRLWAIHIGNGWNGIGYTRYIEKSGRIHAGRPLWAYGARRHERRQRAAWHLLRGQLRRAG